MTAGRPGARATVARQLDLFDAPASAREASPPPAPVLDAADFDDEALIRALPVAVGAAYRPLIEAAGHRRLRDAVPALDALCRHFKGFGAAHPVAEQTLALRALAGIGGWDAARTVARLIADGVIQPPGLPAAVAVAAGLGCRLPPSVAVAMLAHPDATARADTASCAPASDPAVATALIGLLTDPHPAVARAAAQALGRQGRIEARPTLTELLQTAPDADTIAATAAIADDTIIVLLGRIARTCPDLAPAAIEALGDIDDSRAEELLTRLRDSG